MKHASRQPIYRKIEAERQTKVLAFITGDRLGLETMIAGDAVEPFVALLDQVRPTKRLSLILHTNGGHTSAAWRLINLVRSFCDELEVIVPSKALSAGTLMSLGADKILMTKQAVLGPIDPSLPNHPLAPSFPLPNGTPGRIPVSAEAVRAYVKAVQASVTDPAAMASVWTNLASHIQPLVLGEIFRLGEQIRFLAQTLVQNQVKDELKQKAIIDFLCSDSGSHDHTINRRQAKALGLRVESPSEELYLMLSGVAKSYTEELKTLEPYSPRVLLGSDAAVDYQLVRGIIETEGGCYGYVSEGRLVQVQPPNPGAPTGVSDQKAFEGWRRLT